MSGTRVFYGTYLPNEEEYEIVHDPFVRAPFIAYRRKAPSIVLPFRFTDVMGMTLEQLSAINFEDLLSRVKPGSSDDYTLSVAYWRRTKLEKEARGEEPPHWASFDINMARTRQNKSK